MRTKARACRCDALCKLGIERADVGSADERHLLNLLSGSFGNFGVRIAKVHDGELRDEVYVLLPIYIGDDVVLGTLDGHLRRQFREA